jgi:type II secretory pathway pseudopilin PulG
VLLRLLTYAKSLAVIVVALASAQPPISAAQTSAQQTEGRICVLAYNDANRNHTRDAGEGLLPDISVNLMVNNNVIIANYVTDGKEPYCFSNLPPQQYTVGFGSPLYDATSQSTAFSFALTPGEVTTREFGAVPRATPADPSVSTAGLNIPMTTPVRIGLSALGALVVMIFVAGIGMILYGLFLRR